ncbi:MAG: alanine racemase [Clostridiales bacterium]|jgi:alanine racemase|nr:alanine racemase [Clostridiales bacterium]
MNKYVDLSAVAENARLYQTLSGGSLYAVVKADAYGHGRDAAARAAARFSKMLCVARTPDALALRAAGLPVLYIGGFDGAGVGAMSAAGVTLSCGSVPELLAIAKSVGTGSKPPDLHFKADSGMRRLGAATRDELNAMTLTAAENGLPVTGCYTHLYAAAAADVASQCAAFSELTQDLPPGIATHMFSTGSVRAGFPVRCGLGLYGYGRPVGQRPAMTVTATVCALKSVKAGEGVGYSHAYTAAADTTLAVVDCGYGDGYPRLVNTGYVLIRGKRCPVVGAVCMDMLTADVGGLVRPRTGEPVTLLGGGITAPMLAAWANTIPYDILTRFSGN